MRSSGRLEQKFFLNDEQYFSLMYKIDRLLDRDVNGNNGMYTVTSLYLDDAYNRALVDKINGDAVRHKYRIRSYDDDLSTLKLERKSKYQQTVVKASVPLTEIEFHRICNGDFSSMLEKSSDEARMFYSEIACRALKPKVFVKYKRLAFTHPIGSLRITFDSEVKTSGHHCFCNYSDIHYLPAMRSGVYIMELKFSGVVPDFIRNLLHVDHVMAGAASKYVLSRQYGYEY